MLPRLIEVLSNEVSYRAGENLILQFVFAPPFAELARVRNISVDIFCVQKARNQFVRGFGVAPTLTDTTITVTHTLPNDFPDGLYVIGQVSMSRGDNQPIPDHLNFAPLFFAVQQSDQPRISQVELGRIVEQASRDRNAHTQAPIRTQASGRALTSRGFRVLVVGVGCLLQASQPLEGFTIHPIGRGLSYGRMLEIANQALKGCGIRQIDFDLEIEKQFGQATPTFLIDYWNVVAIDEQDALSHSRAHSDLVFDLLGLDRGQKPREIFLAALDRTSGQCWWSFTFPGYGGNLVSDFNPVCTANLIESVTPRLQSDPFLRLLVRSYAEATAEADSSIAVLRAWTVLELLADREISRGQPIAHLDGTAILNARGNLKTTDAKEGRVYEFVRRSGAGFPIHATWHVEGVEQRFLVGAGEEHPGFVPGTRLIPLWDLVRSAYAIRNCVAHEGYFSAETVDRADADQVVAADLISNSPVSPLTWVRDQASLAVRRKLHEA